MNEVMLLQMRQLGEGFRADVTLERSFPGVRPQVHLEVGELAEGLVADIALIVDLAILLLERIGQRLIASRTVGAMTRALVGRHGARRRAREVRR